jgi:signal transduction histidine kinase
MKFKITARTLLHLGGELISSDGIALYELIKNSFDAKSPSVRIDVQLRMSHRALKNLLAEITKWEALPRDKRPSRRDFVDQIRQKAIAAVSMSAPEAVSLRCKLVDVASSQEAARAIRAANRIIVTDSGQGMSADGLVEAFLTIGTREKQRTKARLVEADEVVLGEKGIGRFSAMRLGSLLRVATTQSGNRNWHHLELDWDQFSHDSDELLSDINIEPTVGPKKSKTAVSGTRLEIDDLNRDWTFDRTTAIAQTEFSKLSDPFAARKRFPIGLYYNGDIVPIPSINKVMLRAAHATGKGRFFKGKDGYLLTVELSYEGKDRAFSFQDENLLSITELTADDDPEIIPRIGPFEFEFYWYNRRKLSRTEGVGELDAVRKLQREWSGGLLLYRDGFRVLPYAGPDDDWLALDRMALSRSAFKVNRTQLIGRISITQRHNPFLVDQANREGLRDGEEKRAFVAMLKYVMRETFYSYLVSIDKDRKKAREPVGAEEVEERLEREEDRISRNLKSLIRNVPQLSAHKDAIEEIQAALASIRETMEEVRAMSEEFEEGRSQLLNLAGVGLTVEILAHELNRTTDFALQTLGGMDTTRLSETVGTTLNNLAVQLKTLQKRLRVLDPLSTAGRNRKERFDLIELVRDITTSHRDQFEREQISLDVQIVPATAAKLSMTAVKGMVVQVLENLISNSVYWLRYRKILKPGHHSRIQITIDTADKELSFSDNGPGISRENLDLVFQAFFTTKPAGQGKGLGLYIAREIARYHGASLRIEGPASDGNFKTFILSLEPAA